MLTSRLGTSGGSEGRRAWKSYDWDTLDCLDEEGYISGFYRSKSPWLTEEGAAEARRLLAIYGISEKQ